MNGYLPQSQEHDLNILIHPEQAFNGLPNVHDNCVTAEFIVRHFYYYYYHFFFSKYLYTAITF